MNIGKEIKVRRTELNLTQEDLAKKLNVSRTAISNWEQQRNYPDMELLVTISDELDISLDKLLRGDSKMVKELSLDYKKKKRYKVIIAISIAITLLLTITIFNLWSTKVSIFNTNDLVIESIEKVEIPEKIVAGKKIKKDYKYILKVKNTARFKTFDSSNWSMNNYEQDGKVYVSFQARNTLNIFSNKTSKLEIPNFSGQSGHYNIDKDIYLQGNSPNDLKLIISEKKNQ
ncbi:helix-turn-helix domain-containing protein [Vagococcus fluvialis]|uniref:helix-turn-helix domain-containing protein n=1 Tax=Vagococcus fluvialis TaxID=2738 RepID=UPI003B59AD3C